MAVLLEHLQDSASVDRRLKSDDDGAIVMPTTDGELLRQFQRDRRQEAFSELVTRHASMVLGVCQRILRDEHEAEDVFQATFLVLATKAHKIQRRHTGSLAAWLHKVAYRLALRTARARHRKGRPLVDDVQSTAPEQWLSIAIQEEQLVFHEELSKLPELYREAILLCSLEGVSCKEAAGQIAQHCGSSAKKSGARQADVADAFDATRRCGQRGIDGRGGSIDLRGDPTIVGFSHQ